MLVLKICNEKIVWKVLKLCEKNWIRSLVCWNWETDQYYKNFDKSIKNQTFLKVLKILPSLKFRTQTFFIITLKIQKEIFKNTQIQKNS